LIRKGSWLNDPMGLILLPIAWIVACHRVEPGIASGLTEFDIQGLQAMSRLGIASVLLPEVRRWQSSNETIREVVAWLIKRSVDQHLRIAWSRLAREPNKDVSLLQSDGEDWIYLVITRLNPATLGRDLTVQNQPL
jgi:hypothetical protein